MMVCFTFIIGTLKKKHSHIMLVNPAHSKRKFVDLAHLLYGFYSQVILRTYTCVCVHFTYIFLGMKQPLQITMYARPYECLFVQRLRVARCTPIAPRSTYPVGEEPNGVLSLLFSHFPRSKGKYYGSALYSQVYQNKK